MIVDDRMLVEEIRTAFKQRRMPKGRLILPKYDLQSHAEAKRLDTYLRTQGAIVDRSNYALVCFIYVTDEAALWVLPSAMTSVVENYASDDFFIDVLAGALADGQPDTGFKPQGDLGTRMRRLASEPERRAVCRFRAWLESRIPDAGGERTLAEAEKLWCDEVASE